jgi:DNA primase
MLSKSTIQSVRDLDIYDVVSKYLPLKKQGNLFKGNCPFHDEKTPSFTVNHLKNSYKCFGCGKGGDAIQFVIDYDKLDFINAIEKLAADHNIAIEFEEQTEEQIAAEVDKKNIYDAMVFAQKYFTKNIEDSTVAKSILAKREFNEDDINFWELGFAGDSNFIKNHAQETGQIELYYKASLISANSKNTAHYDFFTNRIIIPIYNERNKIIAFSGRAIDDESPKYINSRNNDLYNKSDVLFGIHKFSQVDKHKPFIVLVEGYFHVFSLHKIGYTNSLAYGGNRLTKSHVAQFKKLAKEIIIFYDNDANKKTNTGLNSTLEQVDHLISEGFLVKVFCGEIGEDADDFCRKLKQNEHGTYDFDLRAKSIDAIKWKTELLLQEAETPDEIATAKQEIANLLFNIKNETLRSEYSKFISKNLKFKEAELKTIFKNIEEEEKKNAEQKKNKDAKFLQEDYPDWFDLDHRKHFNLFQFTSLIRNGETGYYFPDSTWYPTHHTNFVIQPLYMIKSFQNARRMCEVFGFNRLTNKLISEVIDFNEKELLKKEQFESRLAQQSPFITLEGYSNTNHKRLINKLLFEFKDCYELNTLGYQPEQFWAFSNICFEFPSDNNPKGVEREYNDFGVVEIGENSFLSEAKNKRVGQMRLDNNNPYENDLYFIYKKSTVNFSEWCKLMCDVYTEEKAWLAISFSISTVFRDLILSFTKLPHLHCYGEKGSGKSEFAESILHLFFSGKDSEGKLYKPYNLAGGGTPYSFHNRLERFRAAPQVLNEYDDTSILPEFFDAIKASFDGEGRERGMGVKGKTETMKRNATLILCGQKIGNRDDNSVLTRSVTVEFLKKEFTEQERLLFSKLESIKNDGLSSLILEILTHRMHFKKRFSELFLKTVTDLQKRVATIYQKVETRIIKSLAALQLSFVVMAEVITLPLNIAQLEQFVFNKAIEMHAHLQSTDGLSEFWKAIEFLLDRDEIENDWHFKIRSVTSVKLRKSKDGFNVDEQLHFTGEKKLLYIRLKELHQFYCLHVNRSSKTEKPLSEKTIATYMSSQPYWIGLCPGTGFKSLQKNKSKDSTSCYVLDYDLIGINLETSSYEEERIEETIIGKVHKIFEVTGDILKFVVKSTNTEMDKHGAEKTTEKYTNCFTKSANQHLLKIDNDISVDGLVAINMKGYRNMDVTKFNENSEPNSIQEIF